MVNLWNFFVSYLFFFFWILWKRNLIYRGNCNEQFLFCHSNGKAMTVDRIGHLLTEITMSNQIYHVSFTTLRKAIESSSELLVGQMGLLKRSSISLHALHQSLTAAKDYTSIPINWFRSEISKIWNKITGINRFRSFDSSIHHY